MNLDVIVPPPFEPVTLGDVYTHLRLEPDGPTLGHPDDRMLARQITAARMQVEQLTRRSLVQQTLRLSMDGFPSACSGAGVRLQRPPIIRVLSVAYYDADNLVASVDPADWYATDGQMVELRFVDAFGAPTPYARPDAVSIDYVAGYEPDGVDPQTQTDYVANVPAPLKDAVLLGVQLLYDQLAPDQRSAIERTRAALVSGFVYYLV